MNVTIIYGTTKKTSTYNSVQLLLNSLKLNINIKVTEFLLPKDLPSFNRECFSCIINGEEKRTRFNYVDSIVKSLDDADLIILASPAFICDISTDMESFLEHISYRYMQKKTNYSTNNKIGLVMSTVTGAGLFHTTRTLKRNLNLWGINNTFKFSEVLYEIDWEDVTLKSKLQINKKVFKLSNKILDLYSTSHPIKLPILNKVTSSQKSTIFKEYHCNIIDFNYRKNQSCVHIKS